jgi:hypothetical protein
MFASHFDIAKTTQDSTFQNNWKQTKPYKSFLACEAKEQRKHNEHTQTKTTNSKTNTDDKKLYVLVTQHKIK